MKIIDWLLEKHQPSSLPIKALAVIALLLAWFFRYEPIPANGYGAILDRWNGNVFIVGCDEWTDAQSFETRSKE